MKILKAFYQNHETNVPSYINKNIVHENKKNENIQLGKQDSETIKNKNEIQYLDFEKNIKVNENKNNDNIKNKNEKMSQIIQYDFNNDSTTKNIDGNTNKSTFGTNNYDNSIKKDNLISNEDGPIEIENIPFLD